MEWGDCVNSAGIATLKCVPILFKNLINSLFLMAGVVAVFFIVIGGIRLITSGGDQAKVQRAKGTLTFAITGLVVVILSFGILKLIAMVTQTDCIQVMSFGTC